MAVEKAMASDTRVEVIDRILDKGVVVDAWVRISLVGIELLTIEARVEKEMPEEKEMLEDRILDLIRGHPEGIRLTAIAEASGEARIKIGNVCRMLVDEGKIRKEGLLYFPV